MKQYLSIGECSSYMPEAQQFTPPIRFGEA